MKRAWCKECSEFPEIIEENVVVILLKSWDGEKYVTTKDLDAGEEPYQVCKKCGTPIEEERDYVADVPKLQGEVGGEKALPTAEELALDDDDDADYYLSHNLE